MRGVRSLCVSSLLLLACAGKPATTFVPEVDASIPDAGALTIDAGPDCACAEWGNPRNAGAIGDPLVELSGLVASRTQEGVLFAHNDSGDGPRFFALSTTGVVMATFELDGGTARDWEDLAIGPCPSGTCLYLGDIGDNARVRTDYAVYRVTEPSVSAGSASVAWERFRYEYPGGAKHNSEAIFMHPVSGVLYLVTKEDSGPSEVYRFPLPFDASRVAVLEQVATLPFPTSTDRPLTAADVNVCGTAVLLRMYNRVVELRLPPEETNFERVFSAQPLTVPTANEPQGEAVAYAAGGQGYFTASEKFVDPPMLSEYRCR